MFAVAIGGLLGSLARYGIGLIFPNNYRGTLIANLLGALIASIALVYFEHHNKPMVRHFWLPGFCGGLTTFSALMLATDKEGLGYLLLTVVLSLCITAIFVPAARRVYK